MTPTRHGTHDPTRVSENLLLSRESWLTVQIVWQVKFGRAPSHASHYGSPSVSQRSHRQGASSPIRPENMDWVAEPLEVQIQVGGLA